MWVSPFTWEQPSADTNSPTLRGREGQCPYPIHPCLAWTSHSHTFNSFIYLSWFCLTSLHLPTPARTSLLEGVDSLVSPGVAQGRYKSNLESFSLISNFFLMWSDLPLYKEFTCNSTYRRTLQTDHITRYSTRGKWCAELSELFLFFPWLGNSSKSYRPFENQDWRTGEQRTLMEIPPPSP